MGSIRLIRFPDYGVSLNIYSGVITPDDLLAHLATIEVIDGGRWCNYLDQTVDLSAMDVASIPELKRAVAARLRELHGEKHVISALVTASPENELFLHFWPNYVRLDETFPADPEAFPDLQAACAWLGLPEAGRQALMQAVGR